MEKEKMIACVHKAQAGDEDAFAKLFEAFYNSEYYFAVKTLGNPDDACDVVQEAFISVFKSLPTLREPAAFPKWLRKITFYCCTSFFDKQKSMKETVALENEDGDSILDLLEEVDFNAIPHELLEKKEVREAVRKMIDQLSPEQRSAILMQAFEKMSIREIAEIQGVSEGTVKSRLNYAKKSLKKAAEEYEKKTGTRLYSVSFLPLLLLFFLRKQDMPADKAVEIQQNVLNSVHYANVSTPNRGAQPKHTKATGKHSASSGRAAAKSSARAAASTKGAGAAAAKVSVLSHSVVISIAVAAVAIAGVAVAYFATRPAQPDLIPEDTVAVQVTVEDAAGQNTKPAEMEIQGEPAAFSEVFGTYDAWHMPNGSLSVGDSEGYGSTLDMMAPTMFVHENGYFDSFGIRTIRAWCGTYGTLYKVADGHYVTRVADSKNSIDAPEPTEQLMQYIESQKGTTYTFYTPGASVPSGDEVLKALSELSEGDSDYGFYLALKEIYAAGANYGGAPIIQNGIVGSFRIMIDHKYSSVWVSPEGADYWGITHMESAYSPNME